MIDDLSPRMQERLEKWRKNPPSFKSTEILPKRYIGRQVRRDHGDDLREFEEKKKG